MYARCIALNRQLKQVRIISKQDLMCVEDRHECRIQLSTLLPLVEPDSYSLQLQAEPPRVQKQCGVPWEQVEYTKSEDSDGKQQFPITLFWL